jgi:hypothetical protein
LGAFGSLTTGLGGPPVLTARVEQEAILLFFLDPERQVLGDAGRLRGDVLALRGLQLRAGPRGNDGLTFPPRLGGGEPDRER